MPEYYTLILKSVLSISGALSLTGAFCSVGWLQSNRRLKRELSTLSYLHNKVRCQADEIESLRAKNSFLLNRISEVRGEQGDVQMQ